MRPKHEVAEVLAEFGGEFFNTHKLSYHQINVLHAISRCRTAYLGTHSIHSCNKCDYTVFAYNSCRNRHCPKCQSTQREKWIQNQLDRTLPVRHFHLVFTLPHELNGLCLAYPDFMYNLLFRSAWKTIQKFAESRGLKTGMTSILHTWGQNLSLHPHLHCVVPSGGIDRQGKWQNFSKNALYLFPVRNLSKVYRAIFLKGLKKGIKQGEIPALSKTAIEVLYKKDWVVYAKQPFKGVESVMEYLGRYSHKVAISNHRIKSIDSEYVSFTYKSYRSKRKGIMRLHPQEFLRRFSQHILPHGFVRIRHYGLLAAVHNTLRGKLQTQLGKKTKSKAVYTYFNWSTQPKPACPCCKTGKLIQVYKAQIRPPPISQFVFL